MPEKIPETSMNRQFAGRFYTGTDGGFTADQYTDMLMTQLFESAKTAPQPLKTQLLEFKLKYVNIAFRIIREAMADATRRVGRKYELNDHQHGRLMLPGALKQKLDEGGLWSEAQALEPKKD